MPSRSSFRNEALSRRATLDGAPAASSVAAIASYGALPASLRSHRPSRPVDEASLRNEL